MLFHQTRDGFCSSVCVLSHQWSEYCHCAVISCPLNSPFSDINTPMQQKQLPATPPTLCLQPLILLSNRWQVFPLNQWVCCITCYPIMPQEKEANLWQWTSMQWHLQSPSASLPTAGSQEVWHHRVTGQGLWTGAYSKGLTENSCRIES